MDQTNEKEAPKSWWNEELLSAGGISRKEAVIYTLIIVVVLYFGFATGSWVPCPLGSCLPR